MNLDHVPWQEESIEARSDSGRSLVRAFHRGQGAQYHWDLTVDTAQMPLASFQIGNVPVASMKELVRLIAAGLEASDEQP